MLSLFRIPRSLLPTVRASSEKYGMTSAAVLGDEMPIGGIAGDQQSALFGQNCLRHGMVKNTYGTGCFMLLNIGDTPCISQHQLLTSVAWRLGSFGPLMYSLEGSVFVAGAAVQWLRDGLGIIRSSAEIEGLAASVADSGDVYFVPALTGLGAPHWDPHARGAIVGLSRGTTAAHLARAALDGIAFQVTDVLEALRQDAGIALQEMRVDGGAAANSLLMQTQADLLQIPVVRPKNLETTALGAAYLAGLAVGFWSAIDELQTIWARDRVFEPAIGPAEAANRCQRWKTALQRSMNWTV
jgi:glycerol kinase